MRLLKENVLSIIFCFSVLLMNSQTIQIYHGASGATTILSDGMQKGKTASFMFYQGDEITIEILNTHPGLYSYEFNNEEIEISDPEQPEITDLLTVLTSNLSIDLKDNSSKRAPAAIAWSATYKSKVDEYSKALEDAVKIINESDTPRNIQDALISAGNSGFIHAQTKLNLLNIIKENDIKSHTDAFINKIKTNPNYTKTDQEQSNLMALYDSYLTTLSNKLIEIKKTYDKKITSRKSYTIKVNDKINKITLKVKNKNNKINHRDTGDKLVTIEIKPYYKRPVLELIPVALFHKSRGGKRFSIENGVINESDNDEFNFSVGAMLSLNLINWGKSKEYSLGTGVGFALSENTLDNFFFNASVSFKQWARFGVGYGFLRTPTGLQNGLQAGDMATNINDISDVLSFERKPALFFTLVIPGLTLPVSK